MLKQGLQGINRFLADFPLTFEMRQSAAIFHFHAAFWTTMLEPTTISLTLTGVFVIAFMKGGFGGGFAIVGIPLLALVMDPLTAGALLARLFVVMDLFTLRYWKPTTWSKPDLVMLAPGLLAGIVLGTVVLNVLDGRAVAVTISLITFVFSGLWFKGGGVIT